MALLVWKESYSVGVEKLDNQHKKIFSIINELFDKMKSGKTKEAVDQAVNQLYTYALEHFTTEEQLMTRAGYKGLDAQKKEHQDFIEKTKELRKKIASGNVISLSIEVSNFLTKWWHNHIQVMDKKYKDVMKEQGIK